MHLKEYRICMPLTVEEVVMPRKKNWRIGKARKAVCRRSTGTGTCISGISDGGTSQPLPSSVSDVRPSACIDNHRFDTGVDINLDTGVDINPDTGVYMNLDTGVEINLDTGFDINLDTVMNLDTGVDMNLDTVMNLDTGVDINLDTGVDINLDTGVDINLDTGVDMNLDTVMNLDTGVDINLDTGVDINLDTGVDINLDTGVDINLDTGVDINLDTGVDINLDTGVDINLDTGVDINLDTGVDINLDTVMNLDTGVDINLDTGVDMNLDTVMNLDTGVDINLDTGVDMNLDTVMNLDTGVDINLDTGVDINLDTGVDINLDTALNLDTGVDINLDTGVDINLDTGVDMNLDTVMNLDTGVDINLDTGVDINLDTGVDINLDTGVDINLDTGVDMNHDTAILDTTYNLDTGVDMNLDTGVDINLDTGVDINLDTAVNLDTGVDMNLYTKVDMNVGVEQPFIEHGVEQSFIEHGVEQPFTEHGVEQPFIEHGVEQPFIEHGVEQPFTEHGVEQPFIEHGVEHPFTEHGVEQPFTEPGMNKNNSENDDLETGSRHGKELNQSSVDVINLELKDHHNFIFGTFNQGNTMFDAESRGSQCVANALCALIYIRFGKLESSQSLDKVLIEGHRLHKNIIRNLKEKHVYQSLLLNFEEIPDSIKVMDRTVAIGKGNVISGVCTQSSNVSHLPSLHVSLNEAFKKSTYILFIIGSVCSAIFVKDNKYCLFDSHSHGPDGLSIDEGTSILASYRSLDDLVGFMYAMHQSMNIDLTEQFDMLPIKIDSVNKRPAGELKHKEDHVSVEKQTSNLMENYFKDQYERQKRKRLHDRQNDETVNEHKKKKRRDYMRNYKREQRLDSKQKQKDCEWSKESKRKAKQNHHKLEQNRLLSKVSKEKARKDHVRKDKERILTYTSMHKARKDPERRAKEREMTKDSMFKARQDPKRKAKEREMTKDSMFKARLDPERKNKERSFTLKSMHKCRSNRLYKDAEMMKKRGKRRSDSYILQENARNKLRRQSQRSNLDYKCKEKRDKNFGKYGTTIENCIEKFKKNVSKGPVYVCTSCNQTWFKHSVVLFEKMKSKSHLQNIEKFSSGFFSVENLEWICKTCHEKIIKGKVPPMSVYNKNAFHIQPKELELHQLEERLVSLRIPFMQIRELPRGGQLSIKGNVVNVPVDIQPVIHSLPRPLDSECTIPVKLKKKLSYKTCAFTENVRPLHVLTALHWLINHSSLYKESGVTVDDDWVQSITSDCSDTVREFLGSNTSGETIETSENVDDLNYDSDHFSEIDENEKVIGNSDTMLDSADMSRDTSYTFAPGEGQTPLSLYRDPDAEYLSFPTIFCGQRRHQNIEKHVPLHYSDICKLELRHIDRRVASNVPNIFFKLKKIQLKQVSDKVHLALRRCKSEGKTFTASQMLDKSYLQNVVRLDEGYYIFRSLRNSPPYFEARKKDVFAMIRQLGLPTWFISLSSADTRWYDLLNMLSEINNGQTLSKEDIDNLSWIEKTKLVQKDPVTCVRYFDHRVQEFINTVLKSPHNPLGKVSDFFYRVEFQQRGSPHIHMLMWIENAPKYQDNSLAEVTSFIDRYVSCRREPNEPLVDFQVHKHSKSCRKKQKAICRFGFPIAPMKKTTILEPLCDSQDNQKYKDLFKRIQTELDNLKDTNITYEEFLSKIDITEEEYIKAIQSSLNGPKVFLQRNVNEARINAYMKPILKAWGANHDLQFVLDPYACAVYIVSYISKAQRGMSILMNEACKEAKQGNMDLRQQVRHIGNKFLNSVEVSAQEACYLLLQLPLTRASRDVVFINTSTPSQRTFLLKSKESLEKLSSDSTNIEADNVIKRYSKRPKALENWCLADYVSQLDVRYNVSSSSSNDTEHGNEMLNDEALRDERIENMNTYCNEDELPNLGNDEENLVPEHTSSIPGGKIVLKNGIEIIERKHRKVIRYVRFSKKIDVEQFCRERLLLYTPWRNENVDLKQGHNSYQERYRSMKSFIENKALQYEKNADDLDNAMERAQNEEDFNGVAPGNEQSELDDANIGATDSESFMFFDPDRPENQREYDIAADVGLNVASVDISVRRKTMPDSKYRELVHSLNIKQREFFVHVFQTVKLNLEKLLVFLSGGAGVGKSVLVTALFEALQRYLTSDPGDNPENCKILLCAPTGKAAFHINGVTLHSAFRIPASQGYDCKPLTSDTLNTLRTRYKDLSVVMIDEVSMVGNNMLKLVNERLKQIKGSNSLFGGVHMIFIGDLFQLKPVMDGWIFENLKCNFGPLATNLWQDSIVLHELDEIMRQKNDKQFAEILNRLREGNHTEDDIEILKGRLTDANSTDYPQNTTHLFNTNELVNNFNVKSYLTMNTEKINISALDHVLGDDNQSVKHLLISKLPKDPTHTAGLSQTVGIAVGMIYDLCLNLDVDDGLVNGSSCVVRKIDCRQTNTERPSIVWVSFYDEIVGSSWRFKYRHFYNNTINPSWTPIFDCKRNFVYVRKTFVRIQIPLRQSTAKTVHKSQGDTLNKVVIDMDGKRVFPHAHYVAISRSRTLDGLYILNLNESKISVATKVQEEMVRLRESRILKLCYTPVYKMANTHFTFLCHNIQSYKSHQKEFFSDPNVKAADCVCLLETWLTSSDHIDSLQKPGYQLIRADGKQYGSAIPHRGILVYVRDSITILQCSSVTKKDIEMVVLCLLVQDTEVVIATLYKSPSFSCHDLKTFLSENLEQFKEKCLIVHGDININIRNKTTNFETYMQNCFNCTQHVQKPTHFSGSLIDHIYSNISSISTDVIECVWSDHSLIYTAVPRKSM